MHGAAIVSKFRVNAEISKRLTYNADKLNLKDVPKVSINGINIGNQKWKGSHTFLAVALQD